ncbi:MAG: FliH/SctL family protein [Thermoguttaceae bacterium]|nr:FliH/SctL family protein [Thermoguttaceae bacterium]MDW8077452.1 FliH/SctL family protein [Thermoguttaceae bacterium]
MGVIKSGQLRSNQPVIFNFEDLQAQGSRYLAEVRREAAAILAQARRQAEELKAAAKSQGYQDGRREAEQQAQEALTKEVTQRLGTLLPAFQQAVRELQQARLACIDQWNRSCLHVAVEIARRIIRGELSRQPEIPIRWVQEMIELAAGMPQLEIHLHPDDCQLLSPQVEKLLSAEKTGGKLTLVPDPEVEPGGCRLQTRFGTIEAGLSAQLSRVEEELL